MSQQTPDVTPFIPFFTRLAEASGTVIKRYFAAADLVVDTKADESPVTQADKHAEAVMRDLIRHEFPTHGILGEEYGSDNDQAEFVWVLDPIDGTISFAAGCPLFGTLIALLYQGQPILGAVNNPLLNQFCLGDNYTTTFNGKPVKMRPVTSLGQATLLSSDMMHIIHDGKEPGFRALLQQVKLFRMWGDCYGYMMLAMGGGDIMMDARMKPWDLLPLIPVIRGAGGTITTWEGADAVAGSSCVAANSVLHPQVIKILNL